MNTHKLSLIINNNWEKVKGEIRHTWRKLSEQDIEAMTNYDDFVKKITEIYEISEEEIGDKIDLFIKKLNLEPNLTYIQEINEFVHDNVSSLKSKIKESVDIADLSSVKRYLKKNPWKTIGVGVLAVVAIKKMFTFNTSAKK